ncbi:hypothetical protein TIFTF001_016746 [Ficus carica]|uniref:Uncharacterized protein n=1 Tax=Ficus carica TaxID=3494 RepID=A0AA88APE0_FICCA|nr:hypothetical protein TIFTF001_016746 [Ficus carica]
MYGVDPAWEVGASQSWYQSGILPAYFTSPHITSATAQANDVSPTARDRGLRAQLAQQNQGPPDVEVPPAPVNHPAAPDVTTPTYAT